MLPIPSLLSTRSFPLCASTIVFDRVRPSPSEPRVLLVKKGSKMRSRTAAGMPVPGVRHREAHRLSVHRRDVDADRAALGGRLECVGDQVIHQLLHLDRIPLDVRHAGLELRLDGDVAPPELRRVRLQRRPYRHGQGESHARALPLPLRDLAQVLHHPGDAGRLLERGSEQVSVAGPRADVLAHEGDEPDDRRERVVDLVGDAGRERADRGQPPCTEDLVLGGLQGGRPLLHAPLQLGVPGADLLVAPRDLARHVVERQRELAELVAPRRRHRRVLTAGPQRVRRVGEHPDRHGQVAREQVCQADGEGERHAGPEQGVGARPLDRVEGDALRPRQDDAPPHRPDGRERGEPPRSVPSYDAAHRGLQAGETALRERPLVAREGRAGRAGRHDRAARVDEERSVSPRGDLLEARGESLSESSAARTRRRGPSTRTATAIRGTPDRGPRYGWPMATSEASAVASGMLPEKASRSSAATASRCDGGAPPSVGTGSNSGEPTAVPRSERSTRAFTQRSCRKGIPSTSRTWSGSSCASGR